MGKYQPFHDLPAAQFQGLVDDIAKRGVLLPILVDEHGKTIDGHQRRRAAAEAGVECPQVVVEGLTEGEKQGLAITLNLYRRHLSGTERTKAIMQLANLGLSVRRIGNLLGVPKSTVSDTVHHLSESGHLDRPEQVVGADGKSYSSTQPDRPTGKADQLDGPPPGTDPVTGEITGVQSEHLTSAEGGADEDPSGDVQEPSAEQESPASPSVPPVDPTLGYRARARAEESKVRSGLLTLDPERVIATSDEPDHWRQLSDDLRAWLDALDGHLSGPRLQAVK